MFFEHFVGIQNVSQPLCPYVVELNKFVNHFDFGCELLPKVVLIISPRCEECYLYLHSVKQDISPAMWPSALNCRGFKFLSHMVYINHTFNPSCVMNQWMAFSSKNFLRHPLDQPSRTELNVNWQYMWSQYDICFHMMTLQDIACKHPLCQYLDKKCLGLSAKVSINPHCIDLYSQLVSWNNLDYSLNVCPDVTHCKLFVAHCICSANDQGCVIDRWPFLAIPNLTFTCC